MMENLYLFVSDILEDDTILPLETTTILNTLKFCNISTCYHVYLLVQDPILHEQIADDEFLAGYELSSVQVLPAADIPDMARLCQLPVLVSLEQNKEKKEKTQQLPVIIHSGLCGILRCLVKNASALNPDEKYNELLGHKECCLKACAEVSAWTKFCEVDLPSSTGMLLCQKYNEGQKDVSIPVYLLKLEKHFNTPVIVANKSKRLHSKNKQKSIKHAIDKQSTKITHTLESLNITCNQCHSLGDNKVCQCQHNTEDGEHSASSGQVKLEHLFAEGADMTLTDLILFSCLHPLLERWEISCSNLHVALPLVTQWFSRMEKLMVHRWPEHLIKQAQKISYQFCFNRLDETQTIELDIREITSQKLKLQKSIVDDALQKLQKTNSVFDVSRRSSCELDWKNLPSAVHPCDGELPQARSERKCQQLQSMLSAIKSVAKDGDTIVDFCSGGGHLGILVAEQMPRCKVILVENKEESLKRAVQRLKKLHLENVTLCQCNLGYFRGSFDVGTCLHACGTATDLVMEQCLRNKAAFVICPCCYGFVRDTHTITFPRSRQFTENITKEEYYQICHAADQTEANISQAHTGKSCMAAIDSDRSLFARDHAYSVSLVLMEPPTCSPKNHLIIGHKL